MFDVWLRERKIAIDQATAAAAAAKKGNILCAPLETLSRSDQCAMNLSAGPCRECARVLGHPQQIRSGHCTYVPEYPRCLNACLEPHSRSIPGPRMC
eukprot:scaffold273800_cov28-Tisochrysis_lutea.AAC.1